MSLADGHYSFHLGPNRVKSGKRYNSYVFMDLSHFLNKDVHNVSLQLDTQSSVEEWVKGELSPAGACNP